MGGARKGPPLLEAHQRPTPTKPLLADWLGGSNGEASCL